MTTVGASTTAANPVIRHCQGVEEMRACVGLQRDVWGFADEDLVPLRLFVVAEKVGGQVIGAFDGERMIGFTMSVPGHRAGRLYLHSHMLAVLPEYQNRGMGRRLKLFQREDALSKGIDWIEWTFDPLEIKNAFLNIERLGAIVRRYNINQYGITSSPLQGGLPTDRLVAEWWLNSPRVLTLLETGSHPPVATEGTIRIPSHVYSWKKDPSTRGKALELQSHIRERFMDYFKAGLSVVAYEVDAEGNGTFHLGK